MANDLTEEQVRAILNYAPETGVFTWKAARSNVKIGSVAGSLDPHGYLQIKIGGRLYFAHRLAWLLETGSWPADLIDHINGVSDDNRISNLREATRSENMMNARTKKNSRSGYKGVHWHAPCKRWMARITVGGKHKCLGYFLTPEAAHEAYIAAAKERHGEFARFA